MARLWHYKKVEFDTTHNRMWGSDDGDKGDAERGIQESGEQMYKRGAATTEEQTQYTNSFQIGELLKQLAQYQAGVGQAPSGYVNPEQRYAQSGDLGKAYYGQTLAGVQDPYKAYEDTLAPELQLLQGQVNSKWAGRGFKPYGTGMAIEDMGRAGVELAIKKAQDRMNFRGQELARGGELSNWLQSQQQQQYGNLSNLYGQQQQAGLNMMGRQAGQAQAALAPATYGNQAALGSYYGGQAAQQALPGQLIGAAGTALGMAYNPYGTASSLGRTSTGQAISAGYQYPFL